MQDKFRIFCPFHGSRSTEICAESSRPIGRRNPSHQPDWSSFGSSDSFDSPLCPESQCRGEGELVASAYQEQDLYLPLISFRSVYASFSSLRSLLSSISPMALQLLVNAGLMALPIGGAVGTLLGIDAHRSSTGQPPLFTPDRHSGSGGSTGGHDSTGSDSGHPGTTNNGVTTKPYCDLSIGVAPPTQGEAFTCAFLSLIGSRGKKIADPLHS